MAKGKASTRSLKYIVAMVSRFVQGWGNLHGKIYHSRNSTDWPLPYKLAILRGEAILRLRFFDIFIPSIGVIFSDEQKIAAWDSLVLKSTILEDFVNRIGIASHLKREAALSKDASDEKLNLFFMLCAAIHEQEPAVLEIAVDQLMLYQWKQQFQAIVAKDKKLSHEQLRDKLLLRLRKQLGTSVEIKESFIQNADSVDFKILVRGSAGVPWRELVSLIRPRLATARLAAFDAAFELNGDSDLAASAQSEH